MSFSIPQIWKESLMRKKSPLGYEIASWQDVIHIQKINKSHCLPSNMNSSKCLQPTLSMLMTSIFIREQIKKRMHADTNLLTFLSALTELKVWLPGSASKNSSHLSLNYSVLWLVKCCLLKAIADSCNKRKWCTLILHNCSDHVC